MLSCGISPGGLPCTGRRAESLFLLHVRANACLCDVDKMCLCVICMFVISVGWPRATPKRRRNQQQALLSWMGLLVLRQINRPETTR